MKTCFKCNRKLELTEFYKCKGMKDGHLNKCKECTKKDVRLDRQNSENAREYDKCRHRENPARREYNRQVVERFRLKHPEKRKAHTAVSNALRDGKLIKATTCSCGSTRNIIGHHKDYSKLLEVEWMCQQCHARLHALENEVLAD